MKYILIAFLAITYYNVHAQQFLSSDDKDPEAKAILDKLKQEYESYADLEIDFQLTINLPEQEEEIQEGRLLQKGDRYRVDLNTQSIYNNGKYVWLHLKKNNEVQINNLDPDMESNMMSPKDMLSAYDDDKYVYAIVDSPFINGEKQTKIDFKPLDSQSEYAKMSLFVSGMNNDLKKMHILAKDGSRYTLVIKSIDTMTKIKTQEFIFDESLFPGIYIEDLRVD